MPNHQDDVQLALLAQRVEDLHERMSELEKSHYHVRDTVLAWRQCAEPGLCIELRKAVEVHDTQLSNISTDRKVLVQGYKAVALIAGTATAIATVGVSLWKWLESYFHKNP